MAQLRSAFAESAVRFLAVRRNEEVAGLAGLTLERHDQARTAYAHVLRRYRGQGVEEALSAACLGWLQQRGVAEFVWEDAGLTGPGLGRAVAALGLRPVERLLMVRPLALETHLRNQGSNYSRPMQLADMKEAAETLACAFAGRPGRGLCEGTGDREDSLAFLRKLAAGAYGPTRPEFLRVAPARSPEGPRAAGICASVEAARGVGFVLQAAVRPEHQNRGLGALLIEETCRAFRAAGLSQAGLGVTASNPAKRLYERLGFATRREVRTYLWRAADARAEETPQAS